MHIIAKKDLLFEVFSVVQRALPVRTPMPILKGFLLEAKKDEFLVIANNLELGIRAKLDDLKIIKTGHVLIQEKFVDILRQLPDQYVEIEMDPESLRIEISSGKSNFSLYGIDPDEYPAFTDEKKWSSWTCLHFTSKEFLNILKKVTFAVSQDESKPAFKGILLELLADEKILYALATDTYRLALYEKEYIIESGVKPFRLLVPGKVLIEIAKVIEDSGDEIKCYFEENELIICYKNFIFSSRLLSDRYPDLKNVFPASQSTTIWVNTEMMIKMVQRATLLSSGPSQMITLRIDDELIKISAASELGIMNEELLLENKKGENLDEIFLNAKYFLDFLRNFDDDVAHIEFNGSVGPCIFLQDKRKGDNPFLYRYLVLPIKTEKNVL
jgi:DNA polymerase-3 subunit beta